MRFVDTIKDFFSNLSDSLALSGIAGDDGRNWRWLSTLAVIYLIVIIGLGIWWSLPPAPFDIRENAQARSAANDQAIVPGTATTATLIGVIDTLLNKPGGYTHNDLFPPGVVMDNMPQWEYGVLIQSRDLARALREVLSRSQSQSSEDVDLTLAEPRINFQSDNWVLPASESEYLDAQRYLQAYFERLPLRGDGSSQFYARADNLNFWLSMVEKRLGSLSQRLSASVGQRRLNTDLAGDPDATQSTAEPTEMEVRTPWSKVDDIFYESRGAAWALIHFLKAAEIDFAQVLEKKNAVVSLRQIVRELEATQGFIWSPMILNGSGFGLWANHSLVMASYISRANAALIDLSGLLEQG
ncbi:conserved hypothetical protein [Luminiphilus syltensis NOR5-1B]|uniref:DUF2333 domain-containing protein n=1 Tax=Luminiphilus syltensis NOR5-1B TaxID=565045 RepID=B8KW08_9GAMM|nr:DUF2333 family protein [Luminiphilus syltensis]EED35517.1 conserved hypothetical protein [Luminiphilus syltensis NOR5-1B]